MKTKDPQILQITQTVETEEWLGFFKEYQPDASQPDPHSLCNLLNLRSGSVDGLKT